MIIKEINRKYFLDEFESLYNNSYYSGLFKEFNQLFLESKFNYNKLKNTIIPLFIQTLEEWIGQKNPDDVALDTFCKNLFDNNVKMDFMDYSSLWQFMKWLQSSNSLLRKLAILLYSHFITLKRKSLVHRNLIDMKYILSIIVNDENESVRELYQDYLESFGELSNLPLSFQLEIYPLILNSKLFDSKKEMNSNITKIPNPFNQMYSCTITSTPTSSSTSSSSLQFYINPSKITFKSLITVDLIIDCFIKQYDRNENFTIESLIFICYFEISHKSSLSENLKQSIITIYKKNINNLLKFNNNNSNNSNNNNNNNSNNNNRNSKNNINSSNIFDYFISLQNIIYQDTLNYKDNELLSFTLSYFLTTKNQPNQLVQFIEIVSQQSDILINLKKIQILENLFKILRVCGDCQMKSKIIQIFEKHFQIFVSVGVEFSKQLIKVILKDCEVINYSQNYQNLIKMLVETSDNSHLFKPLGVFNNSNYFEKLFSKFEYSNSVGLLNTLVTSLKNCTAKQLEELNQKYHNRLYQLLMNPKNHKSIPLHRYKLIDPLKFLSLNGTIKKLSLEPVRKEIFDNIQEYNILEISGQLIKFSSLFIQSEEYVEIAIGYILKFDEIYSKHEVSQERHEILVEFLALLIELINLKDNHLVKKYHNQLLPIQLKYLRHQILSGDTSNLVVVINYLIIHNGHELILNNIFDFLSKLDNQFYSSQRFILNRLDYTHDILLSYSIIFKNFPYLILTVYTPHQVFQMVAKLLNRFVYYSCYYETLFNSSYIPKISPYISDILNFLISIDTQDSHEFYKLLPQLILEYNHIKNPRHQYFSFFLFLLYDALPHIKNRDCKEYLMSLCVKEFKTLVPSFDPLYPLVSNLKTQEKLKEIFSNSLDDSIKLDSNLKILPPVPMLPDLLYRKIVLQCFQNNTENTSGLKKKKAFPSSELLSLSLVSWKFHSIMSEMLCNIDSCNISIKNDVEDLNYCRYSLLKKPPVYLRYTSLPRFRFQNIEQIINGVQTLEIDCIHVHNDHNMIFCNIFPQLKHLICSGTFKTRLLERIFYSNQGLETFTKNFSNEKTKFNSMEFPTINNIYSKLIETQYLTLQKIIFNIQIDLSNDKNHLYSTLNFIQRIINSSSKNININLSYFVSVSIFKGTIQTTQYNLTIEDINQTISDEIDNLIKLNL
ncbi:hypothetical protein DLAC_02381 [Tieghemostelium lacteum]|uniref:Uncharacterized protein n=1 Tax=Tieghemostelium lacteum TaxID=361077 RepID=A0A152A4T7_TIELA|nr:hypothetical protein DLAC_02381 [Tieghemostelium lacteum]|eukprot:KYR01260.1 hypothetical protein DLAC_02381 [Tieghemostelium lacteum]